MAKSRSLSLPPQSSGNRPNLRRQAYDKKAGRLKNFLKGIPRIIAGKVSQDTPNRKKIYYAFWSAVVQSLFQSIHDGYMAKSTGGQDDMGRHWKPLSPITKIKRWRKRNKKGGLTDIQRKQYKDTNTRGLMTPEQNKKWNKKFAQVHKKLSKEYDEKESKKIAAQIAWKHAKDNGARTLLDTIGEQDYPIMIDSGELVYSLRPGSIVQGHYRKGSQKQIATIHTRGSARIGTKVKHATIAEGPEAWHRPIWPEPLGEWYDRAIEAGRDAVAEVVENIVQTQFK